MESWLLLGRVVCFGFKGAPRVVVRILRCTWIRDSARFEKQRTLPGERLSGATLFPR